MKNPLSVARIYRFFFEPRAGSVFLKHAKKTRRGPSAPSVAAADVWVPIRSFSRPPPPGPPDNQCSPPPKLRAGFPWKYELRPPRNKIGSASLLPWSGGPRPRRVAPPPVVVSATTRLPGRRRFGVWFRGNRLPPPPQRPGSPPPPALKKPRQAKKIRREPGCRRPRGPRLAPRLTMALPLHRGSYPARFPPGPPALSPPQRAGPKRFYIIAPLFLLPAFPFSPAVPPSSLPPLTPLGGGLTPRAR